MKHWALNSVFYHIYPMGLCDAPKHNNLNSHEIPRLEKIYQWLDYFQELGINAVLLGPLFESKTHGYDTIDLHKVDRRLGNYGTLKNLVAELHRRGFKVILDGVFNHVSRDFSAFTDLLHKGKYSQYTDWFCGLNFNGTTPYKDPFHYETWSGHYELVKLNLRNNYVRRYLLGAVERWIHDLGIDGLRLDVADHLDHNFQRELSSFCKNRRPDFWLMGEVVHGDYRNWVQEGKLDSVTNYECYKGLYSSHNDANYFEIAYAFNRQFGENGIYKNLPLFAFADNHDVNRVAVTINNKAHLYPLYCLLFTMPGVPSIYYGSEWALEGRKSNGGDWDLRPCLEPGDLFRRREFQPLFDAVRKFIQIRRNSPALKYGSYRQIHVNHKQFVFERRYEQERIIVAVNSEDSKVSLQVNAEEPDGSVFMDLLGDDRKFAVSGGKLSLDLYPNWAKILKKESIG